MDIKHISRKGYLATMVWSILISCIIVISAAFLGRATLNLSAAITDKPDIALYLLLPEEEIGWSELWRTVKDDEGNEVEKHYMAETKTGKKLIILKKGEEEWYVSYIEELRE